MPLTAYVPKDRYGYKKHKQSVRFSNQLEPGDYVYVQDCAGVVWVAPNGIHMHPEVLGRAKPAVAAGELILERNGLVLLINNESGTFCCDNDSLFVAIGGIIAQGGRCDASAINQRDPNQ